MMNLRSRSIRVRTDVFNSAHRFEMTRSAFLGFRRKRLQTHQTDSWVVATQFLTQPRRP
jgi:hypothetical protein